jgi:uncharacterized circularly permuted ATP-grasp superfamily protein
MKRAGEAVRDYNLLIEQNPDLLDESRQILLERLNQARLVFGGRLLAPYLRPHFVTADEWSNIVAACEVIWGAIEKVGRAASTDRLMLEQLGLTDAERQLARIDPGYEEVSVTSRLDSFLAGDRYSFVELNAECPAGIAYSDVATEIFLSLPLMREFARKHKVTPIYCRQHLLDSLLRIYRRVRSQPERPNIAIVDYRGLPTQREFELFEQYFNSCGYLATIADPRELELRSGKLYCGDFRIDLIYRRVLVSDFLKELDECRALFEAYANGLVVVVNSFRTKYVHKKMLFAVLTDERYQHYFTESEREAIRRHVPWTRKLEDVKTSRCGESINLLEFVRKWREHLVLKPNDEYGGHGIYIGWELDDGAWERAIESALSKDYLVQERVATGREVFPMIDEGGVSMIEQLLDIDPLLFFGRVNGAFTRLSTSSLANVTSGAGMVPTMIVD